MAGRVVRAARRRWVAARAIEGVAAGAAVGAVAAAVVIGVLWWSGLPTLGATLSVLGVCGVCGGSLSLLRVPSMLQVSRRLDEQHHLHDLLSTAVALRQGERVGGGHDPVMTAVVLAHAEAAARRIASEPLRVGRWTAKAYTTVVAASAMTITLSAVASPEARGVGGRGASQSHAPVGAVESAAPVHDDRFGEGSVSSERGARRAAAPSRATDAGVLGKRFDADRSSGAREVVIAREDAGGFAGATEPGEAESHFRTPLAPHARATEGTSLPPPSGGGGDGLWPPGHADPTDSLPVGRVARQKFTPPHAPAWNRADWGVRRAAATEALERGEIAPAHRDVVRAYFSP